MKIECTVEELKGLLNIKTPVAGTTDVKIVLDKDSLTTTLYPKMPNYNW